VRAGERGADSLHRHQPAGDHPRHALPLRRRRAAAFRHGGATGYEGIGGFPDSFTAFANLTVLGLPIPLVLFAVITVFFWLITHRGRFGRHLF
jgi:hypothetical protein